MEKQIKTIVDRFDGEFAVLKSDSHEILWPKEELPGKVGEGDSLVIVISTDAAMTSKRFGEAKKMVSDIFNNGLNKSTKS